MKRGAGLDVARHRAEGDRADQDDDALPPGGRRLVPGEVDSRDLEHVAARRQRLPAGFAVPPDLAVGRAPATENDPAAADVHRRVRLLAEGVVNRDPVADAGDEDPGAVARRDHFRRRRVDRDLVRHEDRPPVVRELDLRPVHRPVRRDSRPWFARSSGTSTTAFFGTLRGGEGFDDVAVGVDDRHRDRVGMPQLEADHRLVGRAVTDRREHLQWPTVSGCHLRAVDRALDELQVLGDREGGSAGQEQAQEDDRREDPLQSGQILRRGG